MATSTKFNCHKNDAHNVKSNVRHAEVYSEPCNMPRIERFVTIVDDY